MEQVQKVMKFARRLKRNGVYVKGWKINKTKWQLEITLIDNNIQSYDMDIVMSERI